MGSSAGDSGVINALLDRPGDVLFVAGAQGRVWRITVDRP
jgi:hypothetical protein